MLSQLRLNLRINNQISIGLQNCPSATPSIYSSEWLTALENKQENWQKLDRILRAQKAAKAPRYDYFGRLIPRLSPPKVRLPKISSPPLDLIQKFQRQLKPLRRSRLLFLLCDLLPKILDYFSQFRLNPDRHFSHQAGQRIREAGAAMEIDAGRAMRFCHCTTLTLPANSREAFEAIAAYSSYAINRLFQIIRRRYPDMNSYFFCWEFQKRGALHLHIAHYHPDESEGMLIGNLLIEQWHKILCDISENSGICLFSNASGKACTARHLHQHHTQPMRKSVAGYFAKYAGKSASDPISPDGKKRFTGLCPKRFWGSSFHLKRIVKENSYSSLFDVSSESEAESRYQNLLSILLEEKIIHANRYEFKKEIEVFNHRKRDWEDRPIRWKKIIAEGFREIFYVTPESYQKLLKAIKIFDESF